MEAQSGKMTANRTNGPGRPARPGPPPLLETIVGRAIPTPYRDDLLGDMREHYISWPRYLQDFAGTVPFVLADHLRRVFCPSADARRADAAVTGSFLLILALDLVTRFLPERPNISTASVVTWNTGLLAIMVTITAFIGLHRLRQTSGWPDVARPLAWLLATSEAGVLVAMVAGVDSGLPNLERYSQWIFQAGTLLFCVQRRVFLPGNR
jgi:hypothetical protein